MFTPVRMYKINVLVLKKHLDRLTSALGECGLVHLVDAVSQSKEKLLSPVSSPEVSRSYQDSLQRCQKLLEVLGIDEETSVPDTHEMSREEIAALLMRIERLCRKPGERLAKLLGEATGLSSESQTLSDFPLQHTSLLKLQNLSHFYMVTGKLGADAFLHARQALGDQAIFIRESETSDKVLILAARRSRWALEDSLNKFGFEPLAIPDAGDADSSAAEARKTLEDKLDLLQHELDECRLAILKISEEYGGILLAIRSQIHVGLAMQKAQTIFGYSNNLYCVSGWVPDDKVTEVRSVIDEATDHTGLVELIEADKDEIVQAGLDEIPVKLHDSVLHRPFQLLINNFSTPNYHELDPSIFVGITFVLMFGYMFGDIGQGLVLLLAGLFLHFTRRKISDTFRDVGTLLGLCGGCAMVFGFLYGSVFGYEEWIKPLWLNPMHQQDLMKLLITAVFLGVIFISMAIIVNIINQFMVKKSFEAVFDKLGFLGLAFYWGALLTAFFSFKSGFKVWMLLMPCLPLLLLLLREPIHNLVVHHNLFNGEGAMNVIIESIIETMETLTNYMSGTISFIRVGAFAISHAALCFAVYTLVGMIRDLPLSGVWAALIIIFGNILIIVFEGMVASIQCVRLEYYELFSRFFRGGGKTYTPFKIDRNQK